MVIGGYAVAFYGHPHYTNDIDFWVLPDPKNAAKLIKVLRDFGFGALDLSLEDFMIPDKVVQLGQPPNRIDIITTISGVDFADCFPATTVTEVDGILLRFIGLDDLKKNKGSTGGLKDLSDLEELG